jgi:hypothetical protein
MIDAGPVDAGDIATAGRTGTPLRFLLREPAPALFTRCREGITQEPPDGVTFRNENYRR